MIKFKHTISIDYQIFQTSKNEPLPVLTFRNRPQYSAALPQIFTIRSVAIPKEKARQLDEMR